MGNPPAAKIWLQWRSIHRLAQKGLSTTVPNEALEEVVVIDPSARPKMRNAPKVLCGSVPLDRQCTAA